LVTPAPSRKDIKALAISRIAAAAGVRMLGGVVELLAKAHKVEIK